MRIIILAIFISMLAAPAIAGDYYIKKYKIHYGNRGETKIEVLVGRKGRRSGSVRAYNVCAKMGSGDTRCGSSAGTISVDKWGQISIGKIHARSTVEGMFIKD